MNFNCFINMTQKQNHYLIHYYCYLINKVLNIIHLIRDTTCEVRQKKKTIFRHIFITFVLCKME